MIRIGIICPSEIAYRRFLPALKETTEFSYAGVAVASKEEWFQEEVSEEKAAAVLGKELEKAEEFQKNYGGEIFDGYETMLASQQIDAVYLPLPPALHYQWAKKALSYGKHVFMEKPFATCRKDAMDLIATAKEKDLALHENYMFAFHDQLSAIREEIKGGSIGDVRLYRVSFGFPRRAAGDFRYNKALGGGAILDCGGYTLKFGAMLLGDTAKVVHARRNYTEEFDVDLYGSAVMENDKGDTVQISFGMDNGYKCDLEVWGSTGSLFTGRVLTAPAGFTPNMIIKTADGEQVKELPADDTFKKSILKFRDCVEQKEEREENYRVIERQAELLEEFLELSE